MKKAFWLLLIALVGFASCKTRTTVIKEHTAIDSVVYHGHEPSWSKNLGMYEVNIRQYTPEGTFKAFAQHVPRLKDLGVGIVWFMPVQPIGKVNRKGSLGSYYSIQDYSAINPEFGTLDEFRNLVKQIHDEGMYVILDWVANHTSWDHEMIDAHPNWFERDSLGNLKPPVPDWTDVVSLNYENPELRQWMIDEMKFWIEECDVDGFRCDYAGGVAVDFWEECRKQLNEIKHVFMLAEWEDPKYVKEAFDLDYGWEFHHIMNTHAKGRATKIEWNMQGKGDVETQTLDSVANYFVRYRERYPQSAYQLNFITNHDENSWAGTVFERYGDAVSTYATMTFTVPGMPLLYSGQEAGLNKRLRFFDKDTINWGDYKYQKFYKKLFQAKKENVALWNGAYGGEFKRVHTSLPDQVFAYSRAKNNNTVLTVLNFSPEQQTVQLKNGPRGDFKEIFTERTEELKHDNPIVIGPWGYKVFVRNE
ncbi:alpha-amylase [Fulvitalea axinellae]|uniref:Alpha-amylase n=1 Tax=Fulvitalea axinellae TaxID=1182444 RepID=A0AAU9D3E3_9BACT|nr:alpha-amylase [Fulvitalea axinellae]